MNSIHTFIFKNMFWVAFVCVSLFYSIWTILISFYTMPKEVRAESSSSPATPKIYLSKT